MNNKTLIEWNADVGTRFLTIHPDGSFDIDKDAPPLFVIGELAKAFIRQQDRIKRLEEAGDELIENLKHRIKTDHSNPIWHTASIKWGKVKNELKP